MLNLTDRTAVDTALDAGNGLYMGLPLYLLEDGSVRNIENQLLAGADTQRAASYAGFVGFAKSDVLSPYTDILALEPFIVKLVAVVAEAPAVTGLTVGDLYFNTTDKKLYVLTAGEGENPNAWAENDPDITAGGKIWYVPSGTSAGLYHWSTDTLALL